METYSPFIISARLLPAVRVSDATVSIQPTDNRGRDGKPQWRWYVDLSDGGEFSGDDLYGWGDAGGMLETLLAFMAACGESVNYHGRTGRDGENADLFPPELAEWCGQNSDEISAAGFDCETANRGRAE
jgi:hypothetical protein